MSRGYQIEWVSVGSSVCHDDCVDLDVGLLTILPEDQMRAILREELSREGWTQESDGSLSTKVQGVDVSLSPDGKIVRASKKVTAKVDVRGTSKENADEELVRAEERKKDQLGTKITKELAQVEAEVKPRVDAVVQRVYIEALKRKAASMGQLDSVVETRGADGELEVTIKILA